MSRSILIAKRGLILLSIAVMLPSIFVFNGFGEEGEIVKTYYKNGKLKSEEPLKDGKIEGRVKIYRESGAIIYIDTYSNDEKTNRKSYDVQGKLEFDQNY